MDKQRKQRKQWIRVRVKKYEFKWWNLHWDSGLRCLEMNFGARQILIYFG